MKTKINDGIVGTVIFSGVALGYKIDAHWLYLPGVIGALMVASAFTGFYPVYFVLNKLMPDTQPAK